MAIEDRILPRSSTVYSVVPAGGGFSVEDLQRIQTAGARIGQKLGGRAPAARKMQLIRFRELAYDRVVVGRNQRLYPHISEEITFIYNNGDMPKYPMRRRNPCQMMDTVAIQRIRPKYWNPRGGILLI